jgi:divalent metal cation (Fe/Co/Zn/Cd) transporter
VLATSSTVQSRSELLSRAVFLSVISVAWNAIVGGAAVLLAFLTGSLSLAGFGLDALIDAGASVALIWRFSVEKREPHRAERVEKLAEAIVGISLIALGVYVAAASLRALATGSHPEASLAATVILVASVLFLPPLALRKRRVADRLRSGALRGDSVLTGVAALLAAISLVSVTLAAGFGVWWADAIGALAVAALVLREGSGALKASREPASL